MKQPKINRAQTQAWMWVRVNGVSHFINVPPNPNPSIGMRRVCAWCKTHQAWETHWVKDLK